MSECESELICGDCLHVMNRIPDGSVDMILCDLPYGITACEWDKVIPLEQLWAHYKRIIKDNGTIVLFGSEPFSSKLRMSNLDMYKYDWIWDKQCSTGFYDCKFRPLKAHETISVFSSGGCSNGSIHPMEYHPQYVVSKSTVNSRVVKSSVFHSGTDKEFISSGTNYPKSIIQCKKERNRLHPTQKPVALLEYLIKTYSNTGETVLDNCMGSGSTGVACVNVGRKFIGIEKDAQFYDTAQMRIRESEAARGARE